MAATTRRKRQVWKGQKLAGGATQQHTINVLRDAKGNKLIPDFVHLTPKYKAGETRSSNYLLDFDADKITVKNMDNNNPLYYDLHAQVFWSPTR